MQPCEYRCMSTICCDGSRITWYGGSGNEKRSGKNEGNVNDTSINWILQITYIYAMVHSPLSLGNSILTIKLFTSAEHLALLVAQLCLLRSISTNEKLNVLRM